MLLNASSEALTSNISRKETLESLINSDLPDLEDPSIREKFSQSQAARLYSLSQNVNPKEITSSSRGITTRKSRGVHKKSRAQLEWES